VNSRRTLGTTLGGVALTILAAGTALAVNVGILGRPVDTTIGSLETTPTIIAEAPVQPTPRYVVVYQDDPSLGNLVPAPTFHPAVAATAPPGGAVAPPASTASTHDDANEGNHEGADDDD